MIILRGFIHYALRCIGWDVTAERGGDLVATDLHGVRYRIKVTQCG